VALAAIADRTKLKLSLLEALERGDLSQWPKGLFRRAYLREYATAVGLSAEALLLEVEQLFPELGEPVRVAQQPDAAEPMRLSFPAASVLATHRVMSSAGAAGLEWMGVVAAGLLVNGFAGWGPLVSCGAVALVYYPLATAATGRTLTVPRVRMLLQRLTARLTARPATEVASAEQAPLYLVGRHQGQGGSSGPPAVHLVPVRASEDVPTQQTAVS
jgi:hypothetical protein